MTMSLFYGVARPKLLAVTVLNEHISSNTGDELVLCDNNGSGYKIVVIAHLYFKQAYIANKVPSILETLCLNILNW